MPQIKQRLEHKAKELGFSQIAFTAAQINPAALQKYRQWLVDGHHGTMHYMQQHAGLRADLSLLLHEAKTVISVVCPYLTEEEKGLSRTMHHGENNAHQGKGLVSLYARRRDYHKVVRSRLATLATEVSRLCSTPNQPCVSRACSDSAPVMEVQLAQQAGLGVRGKHTLLLRRDAGSYFFLGEILTTAKVYDDVPTQNSVNTGILANKTATSKGICGSCQACIAICPTQAIIAPYMLDARRCISYLTIEYRGSIAPELRPLMGTRIFGCDDCQSVCPWNKFAQSSTLPDFAPRGEWTHNDLLAWWAWDEAAFLQHTQGSPIRRIGYAQWQRNLAVALGNVLRSNVAKGNAEQNPVYQRVIHALQYKLPANENAQEHISWALLQAKA